MRIGLFTDTYPPFINGVSTSVYMLKRALEEKGHQVFVVTVNPENMKYEIARELGVTLGPDTSSRMNGTVGGEMTKRLVRLGEQALGNKANF